MVDMGCDSLSAPQHFLVLVIVHMLYCSRIENDINVSKEISAGHLRHPSSVSRVFKDATGIRLGKSGHIYVGSLTVGSECMMSE